ncbi:hypothetical protein [Actinomadura opuntiae]|uniref:hypothetical protein n=1 Tax=Actinomadura sp. OS1-43 TaxID=604315 RepID=UPI00255AF1E9|nr:hypothetical protein [Actinomadura sp. OS1-43]MDL4820482.1 hypothetical protein [Actinomadura sp. OS1-43]
MTHAPAPAPSVHRRALITWIAVYAAITVVQPAIAPATASLPAPLRTLALTAIVVPAVVYVLVPALMRLNPTRPAPCLPND